jgi:hypothetical protein
LQLGVLGFGLLEERDVGGGRPCHAADFDISDVEKNKIFFNIKSRRGL